MQAISAAMVPLGVLDKTDSIQYHRQETMGMMVYRQALNAIHPEAINVFRILYL